MRVVYLFNGVREGLVEKVARGENPGDGFWGMLRLPHFGIEATYLEPENSSPAWLARIWRKYIPIYFIHAPLFFKLLKYDIVFTSVAFGTQLFFALLPLHKPLWIMHDFNITAFLGDGRTLKQKLFRFMVERSGGIVTVGKEEERRLKERFPKIANRIAYIPFGVDTKFFSPQQVPEERQILAVGFDPDRDWKTLFDACEGLGVRVIAATRPARVAKLQPLPAFVEVKQFAIKDLVAEYSRSAVIVLPLDTTKAVNDAMGATSLFEAMAMGKAIVATDTHTVRSYITDAENGLLVQEGDVAAMRAAVVSLLDDKEKSDALGAAAREYAIEHLDAEKVTGDLASFFKRLVV